MMIYFYKKLYQKREMLLGMLLVLLLSLDSTLADNIINPRIIVITQNSEVPLDLSTRDANRIFVENQKITSINAPEGELTGHNDSSGSIYVNINSSAPFTAFIS